MITHQHIALMSMCYWVISPFCNLVQISLSSLELLTFFPKFKMAAASILAFYIMWIWPFRRVDSVVFVFCTKFGSNICSLSHWDRRTYASNVHLMTSCKLTSGFDFWSRGHFRVAVMHLTIKFGAYIYIYSVRRYWHFSEIQEGGSRHLGFSSYVYLAIPACW